MDKTTTSSGNPTFRPSKPAGWVIRCAQILNRLDLAWRNRLRLEERDLAVLRSLPAGAGIILASNHADETDMKECLDLSRRCRRRFLYMMNREAFDEGFGIAGWWLQRLGSFSIERGGHNEEAPSLKWSSNWSGLSYRRRKAPKPTSSKAIPRAMQKRPHVMWFGMTVAPIPPKKNTMAAII
jgi:hypothetical protein